MVDTMEDSTPATKADVTEVVDVLAQATNKTFEYVEKRFDAVENRLDSLDEWQRASLTVVQGIDEQLREYKSHPARIDRLERAVFPRN